MIGKEGRMLEFSPVPVTNRMGNVSPFAMDIIMGSRTVISFVPLTGDCSLSSRIVLKDGVCGVCGVCSVCDVCDVCDAAILVTSTSLYFRFYILYFIFYILYFIFYILYFIFYILYFIFYILFPFYMFFFLVLLP
jgi:hypothetical protein